LTPRFSLIVPAYNEERYLTRLLVSGWRSSTQAWARKYWYEDR
jgi:hypothetical protein